MNDIEAIKSKLDIVDFISEYLTVKKAGRNFKALCPFHSEKTPSFVISPDRQTWHCFGSCAAGGDVIEFYQRWENLEFSEALQALAKRTGVELSRYTPSQNSFKKDKLLAINQLASEYYHYILTSHKLGKRALEYLQDRDIREETAKTFMLGYAPNSWDNILKFLLKKSFSREEIFASGLVVRSAEGRLYDRFRGRVIFTLKNHRGEVIGFAGRMLPPVEGQINDKEAKYVNIPETLLYIKGQTLYGLEITREFIRQKKEAVVVEGEFDLLSSFQAGVTNVVAIKGSALTAEQVTLLKRFCEDIIMSLDSDFAGNEANKRGIEIAENAGLNVKVARLAAGKDPAECVALGVHLWKQSVKDAVPIYDFIIDTAVAKYDKEEVTGKKKIGAEVIPFLARITNPIIASHYVRKLASLLAVTEESIELSMAKTRLIKKSELPDIKMIMPDKGMSREEKIEEYLLSLILQSQDPVSAFKEVQQTLEASDMSNLVIKKIWEILADYFSGHTIFKIEEINPALTAEFAPTFDKAYLADISAVAANEAFFRKELSQTVKEIKKISLRRRAVILSTKIKKAEQEDNERELKILQENLRQVLSQMK